MKKAERELIINAIGAKLRESREEQGMTRQDLGLRLGVQPQRIYEWETGRKSPASYWLPLFARALNLDDPGQLLRGALEQDAQGDCAD